MKIVERPIGFVSAGESLLPTIINDQEGYLAELEKTVPRAAVGPIFHSQIHRPTVHVIHRCQCLENPPVDTTGVTGIIGTTPESFDGVTRHADTELQEI